MVRINLRDFYPFTQEDTYIEVSAEVANMMNAFERAEASYERKIRRYKAYYSLDHKTGIERSILFTSHSPEELYERKLTREELHAAIAQLTDKQAKRIYAHYRSCLRRSDHKRDRFFHCPQKSKHRCTHWYFPQTSENSKKFIALNRNNQSFQAERILVVSFENWICFE